MIRSRRALPCALTLATSAGVACSSDTGQLGVVARDSAGVRIVESPATGWANGRGWSLAPEPAISIGQADGSAEHEFHEVAAALRLGDGRIVVADVAYAAPVRYFGPDGTFLFGVGRRGPGPEEFQRIGSLQRLDADSVLVVDDGARSAVLLDPSGKILETVSFRSQAGPVPSTVRRLPDGRWVGFLDGFDAKNTEPVGLQRMQTTVIILSESGAPIDTLGIFAGLDMAFLEGRMGLVPFGRAFSFAVGNDGIYVGTGDELRFDIYAASGEETRSVRANGLDLTLTDADVVAFKEATLAALPNDEARAQISSYLDDVPRLQRKAAYTRMLIDPDGAVWLGPYESPFGAFGPWRVFAAGGEYLGELDVPGRLRVLDVGTDYVLGRWQDELGVESLRVYVLNK